MLADIYEEYRTDPKFDHLRHEGIVLVPGETNVASPKLFVVGEAPGAMENTLRRPFVGASGMILRKLLEESAGISASEAFITNVVKYRPPGNRTPEPPEIARSVPYLQREFAAVGSPRVIVAVGGTAKQALRPGENRGVLQLAGKPIALDGGRTTLWVMIHPAYGLRNPAIRDTMESHWVALGNWGRQQGLL